MQQSIIERCASADFLLTNSLKLRNDLRRTFWLSGLVVVTVREWNEVNEIRLLQRKNESSRRCPKVINDKAEATSGGNCFYIMAPATGNVRRPTIKYRSSQLPVYHLNRLTVRKLILVIVQQKQTFIRKSRRKERDNSQLIRDLPCNT